jgi:hypothetical protein
MTPDRLDELAGQLFDAARRDQPPETTHRRIALAMRRQREAPVSAPWPRTTVAIAAGVTALAAGTWLLVRERHAPVNITAEAIPPASRTAPEIFSAPATVPSRRPPPAELRVRPSSERPKSPATLADELAVLQRARAALGSGDPERALGELDRYDRMLQGRKLESEATLLRIEALSRAGRADQAAVLARRFIESNPNHPLVDQARRYADTGQVQ